MIRTRVMLVCAALALAVACGGETVPSAIRSPDAQAVIEQLVESHGAGQAGEDPPRGDPGRRALAPRGRRSGQSLRGSARNSSLRTPGELDRVFRRIQLVMEQIDGHLHEVRREILLPLDLDTGPVAGRGPPVQRRGPRRARRRGPVHSKVAFLALLNFPVHTLAERLEMGPHWDRETWARSRMMDRFADRDSRGRLARDHAGLHRGRPVHRRLQHPHGPARDPRGRAAVSRRAAPDHPLGAARRVEIAVRRGGRAGAAAHDRARDGAHRAPGDPAGRDRQRRPALVAGEQRGLAARRRARDAARAHRRRARAGHALRQPARPVPRRARGRPLHARPPRPTSTAGSTIDRQIPESEVEALLASVLASEEFQRPAELIRSRLGRPLEPFDIWYDGFKARSDSPRGGAGPPRLRALPRRRRRSRTTCRGSSTRLGFTSDKAAWLAERIVVDPVPGRRARHGRRAPARTRPTCAPASPRAVWTTRATTSPFTSWDTTSSRSSRSTGSTTGGSTACPTPRFTEALAFVFQDRDLELLGLDPPGEARRQLEALDTLWSTAEIGGVSLVDMGVWRWMYDHPEADARRVARGDAGDRPRRVEPLLRAGLRRARTRRFSPSTRT